MKYFGLIAACAATTGAAADPTLDTYLTWWSHVNATAKLPSGLKQHSKGIGAWQTGPGAGENYVECCRVSFRFFFVIRASALSTFRLPVWMVAVPAPSFVLLSSASSMLLKIVNVQ